MILFLIQVYALILNVHIFVKRKKGPGLTKGTVYQEDGVNGKNSVKH